MLTPGQQQELFVFLTTLKCEEWDVEEFNFNHIRNIIFSQGCRPPLLIDEIAVTIIIEIPVIGKCNLNEKGMSKSMTVKKSPKLMKGYSLNESPFSIQKTDSILFIKSNQNSNSIDLVQESLGYLLHI